jgi:hypothetical protein
VSDQNTAIFKNDYEAEFIARGVFFRPGVQYDIRPGATSTHPATGIVAFHIQLTL